MNKTIVKLGLLLALTLPAGAMELPEAPEVPGKANVLGMSNEEIENKAKEIRSVLADLEAVAVVACDLTRETHYEIQSAGKKKRSVIYDSKTGNFNTDVLVNCIQKWLEEIVKMELNRDEKFVEGIISQIVTIITGDKDYSPAKKNKIIKYVRAFNDIDDEDDKQEYIDHIGWYKIESIKNFGDIIKIYDKTLEIIPELRDRLNIFQKETEDFRKCQNRPGGDIDTVYCLLNKFFGRTVESDDSDDFETSKQNEKLYDKETDKTKKLFALIEKVKDCMEQIKGFAGLQAIEVDWSFNLKNNVDIGEFLVRHEKPIKWQAAWGKKPKAIDDGIKLNISRDAKNFTATIKPGPTEELYHLCADVFKDLFDREWAGAIESFKINGSVLSNAKALIPEWFTKLPNIKVFEVENDFKHGFVSPLQDDELSRCLPCAKKLVSFTIKDYSGTQFKFSTLSFSKPLVCLEKTVRALSELPNLQYVDLSNNYSNELDASLVNALIELGCRPNVKLLNLKNNNIKKEDKERLRKEIYAANSTITLALDD